MKKILTVAEMALRELLRRRSVLLILMLLPLLFYLSRRGDHLGQSIRFVCLGLGWALSTAALFAGSASRAMEPRLRLSGYRPHQLYLGRLGALWTVGFLLSAPYFVLILVDQHDVRYGSVALIMALTVAVSAPFGLALSSVLPRELEGTLVLLMVIGLQMMADPSGLIARLLPFWSSREIGTYAIDHTDVGYLTRGIAHGVLSFVFLLGAVALASGIRLRHRSHLKFVQ
ncbi:ABC transporter permease [Amycolatopsis sp. QT-25]|uniref:ABC transporter permease n=1 Tax=Amycolatopsis sp. QT-25 TaxID=3034022 RepID=UPI0023EC3358|nr:ABC transporter permease [Amycolatopsis sp. QT-25]WET78723.1 ABC transporter permease [Amycolatopsis sp. QT-25]